MVGLSDRKVKLRCPFSGREVEWDRFCYLVEERPAPGLILIEPDFGFSGMAIFRMFFSTVKLFCTEMACRVADRAVQIFGGMGYMKDFP